MEISLKMEIEIINLEKYLRLYKDYFYGKVEDKEFLMRCIRCNNLFGIRLSSCIPPHNYGFCTEFCFNAYYNITDRDIEKLEKEIYNPKPRTIPEPILKLYSKGCIVCGFKKVLHKHHIIPISKGGGDNEENLVILCPNHHCMVHSSKLNLDKYLQGGKKCK